MPILKAIIYFCDMQNKSYNSNFILKDLVQQISRAENEMESVKAYEISDAIQ